MKITAETQRTRRGKETGEWESEKGGAVRFFTVTQLESEVKYADLRDIRGFAAV
jgi:biotin-(acetyl-CoA carboxylase) ligase